MKAKIKILFIVSTLQRCGPTNQLFNIVTNLDDQVFDKKIITLSSESQDSLKSKFVSAGILVESLNLGRLLGILFGWQRLLLKVKKIAPDVVHTQGIRSDFYAVRLMSRSLKTVSTLRCIPHEDYPMKYGRVVGKIMANLHLRILRKIDTVAAVSYTISNTMEKEGLVTTTIQNGCDLIQYNTVSKPYKNELRRRLSLPQDKIILISVGHLSKRKDPLTIIKAFKFCKSSMRYHLVFIGDGELKNECMKLSASVPNISFIGRVSNVNEYLQASDVFLSASLSEGLPNTVLESLACGIPTILTEISQHTEVFPGKLDKFKFFKSGSVNELASILDNLDLDVYKALSTRSIVENNFDSKKMSVKYQIIYKRLIKVSEDHLK